MQRAWRVIGENRALSRFEALRISTAPLVGCEEELELLLRRWAQIKVEGERVVVLISGGRHRQIATCRRAARAQMARLDRLGPIAKDIAQKRLCHRPRVRLRTISDDWRAPGIELRDGLERLTQAGLLFARGAPPDATYTFKHALVQDAAYGTLLRSRRQDLYWRSAIRHFHGCATLLPPCKLWSVNHDWGE